MDELDTASGQSTQINVSIDTDDKENNDESIVVTNEADHFSLSPSGRRAVISTHGEMFTIATERGDVAPVSPSPWRWRRCRSGRLMASGSPSSPTRSGQDEIWICDQLGEKLKKVTDSATEKNQPEWSPDSQYLLYSDSERKLHRLNVATGKIDVVSNDMGGRGGASYNFSPDGKWVSYSRQGKDQRAHVYVSAAAGGDEHRIDSEDSFGSGGAAWTRDGKAILYTTGGVPGGGIASVGGGAGTIDLNIVSLTHLDKNPADRDRG